MNAQTQSPGLLPLKNCAPACSAKLSRRSVLLDPSGTQAGFAPLTLIHRKFTAAPPKRNCTLGPATLWLRVLVLRRLLRRATNTGTKPSPFAARRQQESSAVPPPPPSSAVSRAWTAAWTPRPPPLNNCADRRWILAGCLWIPGRLQGDTTRRRGVSAVLQRTPM